MHATIVPTDERLFIAIGLSGAECNQLLDSKPVQGVLPNDKRLRLWATTPAVRDHPDKVGLAAGSDYTIMLMTRQVKHIAQYRRAVDFRQEHHGVKMCFLFYGSEHCRAKDVLAVPLSESKVKIRIGNG